MLMQTNPSGKRVVTIHDMVEFLESKSDQKEIDEVLNVIYYEYGKPVHDKIKEIMIVKLRKRKLEEMELMDGL
jgi:hypothetical protein